MDKKSSSLKWFMANPDNLFRDNQEEMQLEKETRMSKRYELKKRVLSKILEKMKVTRPASIDSIMSKEASDFSASELELGDKVYKRGSKFIGEIVDKEDEYLLVKFGGKVMPCWRLELRKI